MIYRTILMTFKYKKAIFVFAFTSIVTLVLYYIALLYSTSLTDYLKANTMLFVTLQAVSSIVNSILVGLSFAMFYVVYKNQKQASSTNALQALVSLFFSVVTTGCYVCGSILIPFFGLAASFATLPFGGLEIRLLTTIMLVYSIREFSKIILGICDLNTNKEIKIKFNNGGQINFKLKTWYQFKPILVSLVFVVLIFILPMISSSLGFKSLINHEVGYSCNQNK